MMKKFALLLFGLSALFFAVPTIRAFALEESEPFAGSVLCAPGVQGECLDAGPAAYIRRMEAEGIKLPYVKFAGTAPDNALNYLPFLYGEVVTSNAPVYGSIEDASKAVNPIYKMSGAFQYISYEYTDVLNDMRVYMIAPGVWMNAIDVHRVGTPTFQGLVFSTTPRNPFGWILTPVETQTEPGYASGSMTGKWLNRLEIMQIFGVEEVADVQWLQVRPGEWIEKRFIGVVWPRSTPPSDQIQNNRWIEVNLYEQTISVYDGGRLVFATIISTGIEPFWTRPGLFQVREKLVTTPMSGSFEADRSDAYYLEDVPWTMYYDEARALHGAYWHTGYGYPRSHGCVNMSPGDAQWLFNWAEVGDWVYVHDPSGQTPTDPSLYSSGGA